jgi:hypothetical protein
MGSLPGIISAIIAVIFGLLGLILLAAGSFLGLMFLIFAFVLAFLGIAMLNAPTIPNFQVIGNRYANTPYPTSIRNTMPATSNPGPANTFLVQKNVQRAYLVPLILGLIYLLTNWFLGVLMLIVAAWLFFNPAVGRKTQQFRIMPSYTGFQSIDSDGFE